MTKRIYIIGALLGFVLNTFAQQDPMYSEYVFNELIINPAFAGNREVLNTTLLYRNQWVNIPGAPKTGMLSVDAPIRNQKVGLGLNLEFDKIGVTSHKAITGIYSYKIKFKESSLTMGLQAGIGFTASDFTSVKYSESENNDNAFQTNYREALPNFGFGLYYSSNSFFAGLSIPQLAGHAIQKAIKKDDGPIQLDLANHYFLMTGYLFTISPDFKIKPSMLLKYVNGAPLEFDINGVFYMYDLAAIGISYRSLASLNIMAQIKVSNQLYVGYAYEYSTNLNSFSRGSHEIILQYLFDFSRAKIITPRFF